MKNIELKCYDCYQSSIATVARHFNHNYQLVALGRIGFRYDRINSSCIGERIYPYEYRAIDNWNEMVGVSQRQYSIDSEQTLKALLKNEMPILLWTDLYDCNWSQAFKKYHFTHCYLLNRYEENKENIIFYAQDPFFEVDEIQQTYEQISHMINVYDVLEIRHKSFNSTLQIYDELKKDAEYFFFNDAGGNIRQFAKDLQDVNFEIENNYPDMDLYAVPLIDNLKIVGNRRAAYSALIKHLSDMYNADMNNILEGLDESYKKWELARIVLIKKFMSYEQKPEMGVIVELLNDIATLEEFVFKQILEINI